MCQVDDKTIVADGSDAPHSYLLDLCNYCVDNNIIWNEKSALVFIDFFHAQADKILVRVRELNQGLK